MPPTADEIRRTFIQFFESKPASGAGGHTFWPSSPSVPLEDPTLLFTNAGMNQFKPLFLNNVDPSSPIARLKRAANSQKCIRAGGKHNDLEDVGKDTYHHTFFEMLGNWSFGDYFKAESISWGWELLTKVFGIAPDRLYATYFAGNVQAGLEPDHEARDIWRKFLPEERIIPGNMKDNFWEMGDTGPCGPCSEIHYDRIGGRNAAELVNTGDPDVLEIWNHVFIQFNREDGGILKPLPARHVDTGMGLERLVSVLQNVRSNYDTDLFAPLFLAIERVTHARKPYTGKLGAADKDNSDTAYRVIADHIRTLTFAITDGALPSNEGRGYVLRRILRRAVRFGNQVLGAKPGFFSELVPSVVDRMGDFYPELRRDADRVREIIRGEEESFNRTLNRGIILFDEACVRAFQSARLSPHLQASGARLEAQRDDDGWALMIRSKDSGELVDAAKLRDVTTVWTDTRFGPTRGLSAEDAFKLYDTYGFPVDLTNLMAEERGLKVDMAGFNRLMEEAREKARAGGRFSAAAGELAFPPDAVARLKYLGIEPTDDSEKYSGREIRATVRAIWNGSDFDDSIDSSSGMKPVAVILDRTPMYAEMGGQVADTGRLIVTRETLPTSRELDSDKLTASGGEFRVEHVTASAGYILHIGRIHKRELRVGDEVRITVDATRRAGISANHTATHLINLGLRTVLGGEVNQKGSLVAPDRLRFDFSHSKPVTPEECERVQTIVQQAVRQDLPVHTEIVPLDKAKTIPGVRAVFGEAYPDPVRVVSIGRRVDGLLSESDAKRAMETSAEFCGGTHVATTGEIQHFVLISEEAVAKGIRRLSGVTGVPAQAAIAASENLAQRMKDAERLEGVALQTEVKQLGQDVDQFTLPIPAKNKLRATLASLGERVKLATKNASAERAAAAVARAAAIADSPEFEGTSIVSTIDAGTDRDAIAAALNTIRTRKPRSAVLLISPCEIEKKLTIVAAVPDALIKRGLNAGEWVRTAAAACGGKGGGKPDQAQGGGTDLEKIKDALDAAKAFAFAKCPN